MACVVLAFVFFRRWLDGRNRKKKDENHKWQARPIAQFSFSFLNARLVADEKVDAHLADFLDAPEKHLVADNDNLQLGKSRGSGSVTESRAKVSSSFVPFHCSLPGTGCLLKTLPASCQL